MAEDLQDKKTNNLIEPKECVVCYTDGVSEGSVQTKCEHFLCLPCYTNIIILKGGKSQCPYCRKSFLKPDEIIVTSFTGGSSSNGTYTGISQSQYTYYGTGSSAPPLYSSIGTPSTYIGSSSAYIGVGTSTPIYTSSYTGTNNGFSGTNNGFSGTNNGFSGASGGSSLYISSYTGPNNSFSGTGNGTTYVSLAPSSSYISSYTTQNNENNN